MAAAAHGMERVEWRERVAGIDGARHRHARERKRQRLHSRLQ
jgi:hypothetical protein